MLQRCVSKQVNVYTYIYYSLAEWYAFCLLKVECRLEYYKFSIKTEYVVVAEQEGLRDSVELSMHE